MILSTEIMNSFKCKKDTLHLNFKRISTDIYQLYVDEAAAATLALQERRYIVLYTNLPGWLNTENS